MRVISGIYKRRRFDVPHTFKARPTTDFAKENLFNVLSNNYFDFENGVTALDRSSIRLERSGKYPHPYFRKRDFKGRRIIGIGTWQREPFRG